MAPLPVVDIFSRRGYRFRGTAGLMPEGTPEHAFVADPLWAQHGKTYPVHQAIKVRLEQVHEIRSLAYWGRVRHALLRYLIVFRLCLSPS